MTYGSLMFSSLDFSCLSAQDPRIQDHPVNGRSVCDQRKAEATNLGDFKFHLLGNLSCKAARIALSTASVAIVLDLALPAYAQEDNSLSMDHALPQLPPQPDPRRFTPVIPRTLNPFRTSRPTCDKNDSKTTVEGCQSVLQYEKGQLAWMHYNVEHDLVHPDSVLGQARIRLFEQKLEHDRQSLRYVLLHPSQFSTPSTALQKHSDSDSYILTPDATAAATGPKISSNWAGSGSFSSLKGSAEYQQILGISGTITVPEISIPTSAGGNGTCSGIANYFYFTSWWLGTWGTYSDLFQAGIVAYIPCGNGTTQPYPAVYQVFEEIPETEGPVILGTVVAGSVININISVNADPVTYNPVMSWVMTGDFANTGSDNSGSDSGFPTGSVEAIAERNFPLGLPAQGKPAPAYPVPFSQSQSVFSNVNYSSSIQNDSTTTNFSSELNTTYGTPQVCGKGYSIPTTRCMNATLFSTNSNPCDLLTGDITDAEGGGADYTYFKATRSAWSYYCMTDYTSFSTL